MDTKQSNHTVFNTKKLIALGEKKKEEEIYSRIGTKSSVTIKQESEYKDFLSGIVDKIHLFKGTYKGKEFSMYYGKIHASYANMLLEQPDSIGQELSLIHEGKKKGVIQDAKSSNAQDNDFEGILIIEKSESKNKCGKGLVQERLPACHFILLDSARGPVSRGALRDFLEDDVEEDSGQVRTDDDRKKDPDFLHTLNKLLRQEMRPEDMPSCFFGPESPPHSSAADNDLEIDAQPESRRRTDAPFFGQSLDISFKEKVKIERPQEKGEGNFDNLDILLHQLPFVKNLVEMGFGNAAIKEAMETYIEIHRNVQFSFDDVLSILLDKTKEETSSSISVATETETSTATAHTQTEKTVMT